MNTAIAVDSAPAQQSFDEPPVTDGPPPPRFTRFANDNGPLTKRITRNEHGELTISPSAYLARGTYTTLEARSMNELSQVISNVAFNNALCWGVAKESPSGVIRTATVVAGESNPRAIARTAFSARV